MARAAVSAKQDDFAVSERELELDGEDGRKTDGEIEGRDGGDSGRCAERERKPGPGKREIVMGAAIDGAPGARGSRFSLVAPWAPC